MPARILFLTGAGNSFVLALMKASDPAWVLVLAAVLARATLAWWGLPLICLLPEAVLGHCRGLGCFSSSERLAETAFAPPSPSVLSVKQLRHHIKTLLVRAVSREFQTSQGEQLSGTGAGQPPTREAEV